MRRKRGGEDTARQLHVGDPEKQIAVRGGEFDADMAVEERGGGGMSIQEKTHSDGPHIL